MTTRQPSRSGGRTTSSVSVSAFQAKSPRSIAERSSRYSTVAGTIIAWRDLSALMSSGPTLGVLSLSATTSKRELNTVSEFCFSNASIALPVVKATVLEDRAQVLQEVICADLR